MVNGYPYAVLIGSEVGEPTIVRHPLLQGLVVQEGLEIYMCLHEGRVVRDSTLKEITLTSSFDELFRGTY